MGQRLVISIEKGDKKLCNIYYHWSAYTYSALLETKKIIDCIYNHKDESESELLLRLIRFCEKNGGGIRGTTEEHEYVRSLYPNETFLKDGYSRNDGLIALSEKSIADMQSWSEGDVYINLDNDSVDFCVYSGYENLDEYIEERKEWDDGFDGLDYEDIPDIGCELGYFDVADIDKIIKAFDAIPNNVFVVRNNCEVIEMIA